MNPKTYVGPVRNFASNGIGIDLHKTTLTIGVRDSIGELVNTTLFPTKCVDKITHFFSHFPSPVHCAIESVGMYEWLWKMHQTREPFKRGRLSSHHNKRANRARLQAKMTRLKAEMDRLQTMAAVCHIKPGATS